MKPHARALTKHYHTNNQNKKPYWQRGSYL